MDELLAAYAVLVSAADGVDNPALRSAVEAFQPLFFNNLVLALDECFLHRGRNIEGKDGNPLNEVRILCGSILHNVNLLTGDKTIKFKPEASVLKLELGDEIRIDQAGFERLAAAFFDEIEKRYLA